MKVVHIGALIKQIISEKRLTVQEVAEGVNLTRTAVHNTFKERDMKTDKIRRFCDFLNYNLFAHLSEESPYSNPASNTPQAKELPFNYNVQNPRIQLIIDIDESNRDQILKLIPEVGKVFKKKTI